MTTAQRFQRLHDVLARRQPDLTVLMERLHKPHNFAAVLRSCDAVGVHLAHAVTDEPIRMHRAVSAGTRRWVRVRRHRSTAEALGALRAEGFRLVAAHPSDAAVDFRTVDYTRPTALVLGTELEGLSEEALRGVDEYVSIPMRGMVPSLNVSVAAAVILFEAQRQRNAAGLYARQRLDNATFNRLLFEWAYPRLARHCRRHGVRYPRLDRDGLLLDPLPRGSGDPA